MDRRVFRPEPTTSKNHQRNALGLSAAVLLLLGLLAAAYFVLRLRFGRAARSSKASAEMSDAVPRSKRRHRFPAAPPE